MYCLIIFVRHFGPLNVHPTSGNVRGYPEFHLGKSNFCGRHSFVELSYFFIIIYCDATLDNDKDYYVTNRANNVDWHSDVLYEKQPAGTTFFFILDQVTILPNLPFLVPHSPYPSLKLVAVTLSSFLRLSLQLTFSQI